MRVKTRSEAPLSDNERFRLLIEAVTDYAIYMLDPNGIVASWNPGAQRFKGYTKQEIIGQHFSCLYAEEDRAAGLPARALETAAGKGRFEQEGWRVRKDGSRIWAHVVIDPIRDPSGQLIGFAKVTRDITERKKAQDALRRSEESFRLLVRGVTDYAIYMLDLDGRVTNWNAGAQRFKGYLEEEIVGEHFSRFYTQEDRDTDLPRRALETALREGRFEHEGWRVRKDGSRFWAHVVIDPIRDDQDVLVGFAKVTRDITERREAQKALEAARSTLLQAQKMETIGQLTGGIAHDFNNLLAVVLGNLELLRKRLPDDQKVRRLLENSVEAAQRGAALTRRMLAFARRQDLKVEPVDIPELVRNMADLLQRSIGPTMHVETRFPLHLAPALVDSNQLELALLNLVVNARDAMPEGGTITIGARQATGPESPGGTLVGDYICLSVSDTGQGMDEETLKRAIEPFFTTKGVGKGTGLGLSMIHGLAEQSGGRLLLRSREGEGTTAELWLPLADGAAIAGPSTNSGQDARRAHQVPRRLKALVVDDDRLVLTNTAAMLEDLGHEVIEAASAEEAVSILRCERDIDLVITDHLMPGMTGLQLIGAIRSEWPRLPVMLATGYAELASGAGARVPKLGKPFAQADLARAIAAAIESASGDIGRALHLPQQR